MKKILCCVACMCFLLVGSCKIHAMRSCSFRRRRGAGSEVRVRIIPDGGYNLCDWNMILPIPKGVILMPGGCFKKYARILKTMLHDDIETFQVLFLECTGMFLGTSRCDVPIDKQGLLRHKAFFQRYDFDLFDARSNKFKLPVFDIACAILHSFFILRDEGFELRPPVDGLECY